MAAKKLSRKELLNQNDEFLSITNRVILYVKEHSQVFSNIFSGILLVILIGVILYTIKMYIDKKGQEAYNEALNALMQYEQAPADKKEEALEKAETLFRKVRDERNYAKVSKLVPPQLAYFKFQEQKYDEAIALYRDYQKKTSVDSVYYILADLAIAACHEEKGDYAAAIQVLEPDLNSSKDFLKEQVMMSLTRNYRLAGQNDKAKETLKQLVEKFPKSSYIPMAKAQLAQLP